MASSRSARLLTDGLREALSGPPAMAGCRLLSERQLAVRLGTSHAQVRRAIRELVDEGVLVQRRGDGTYLRRLPVPTLDAHDEPAAPAIRAEQVLHGLASPEADPLAAEKQLTIGMWWDAPSMMGPVQQTILEGIMGRIEARAHRLALHNFRRADGDLMDAEQVVQSMRTRGSDGYLVPAWRGEVFKRAQAAGASPMLGFGTNMLLSNSASSVPHVLYDAEGAWRAAMERLEDAGCRRVLNVHLDPADGQQTARLRDCIRRQRLPADVLAFPNRTPTADVIAAIEAMLAGSNPPDGILVSDDHMLEATAEALRRRRLTPGRDLAVITFSNRGGELPEGADWSRMELDVEAFGATVADHLLRMIEDSSHVPIDLAVRLRWCPGQTHHLKR